MLQATAQSPTPAPSAPTPTQSATGPAPTAAPVTGTQLTAPTSNAGINALRRQRSELSNQLESAAGRREELASELSKAEPASQPGIQARIDLLDQRILQIESDIATSGQLLISAQGTVQGDQNPFSGDSNVDFTAVSIVFTIFVLAPLAVTFARQIWRRGSVSKGDAQMQRDNSERLKRLENSVDAIAIEMERVSEGQRFVTKLLAESKDRLRVEAPRS